MFQRLRGGKRTLAVEFGQIEQAGQLVRNIEIIGEGNVFRPFGVEQQGAQLLLQQRGGCRLPVTFARQLVAFGGHMALRRGLPHQLRQIIRVDAGFFAELLAQQIR